MIDFCCFGNCRHCRQRLHAASLLRKIHQPVQDVVIAVPADVVVQDYVRDCLFLQPVFLIYFGAVEVFIQFVQGNIFGYFQRHIYQLHLNLF